jgi:hypothetical protein
MPIWDAVDKAIDRVPTLKPTKQNRKNFLMQQQSVHPLGLIELLFWMIRVLNI